MDIEQAVMTRPDAARSMFRDYRQAITDKRATRDDVAIYRGLRAVLRGAKVIDINMAMGLGGRNVHGQPKFAIVRADAPTTYCRGSGSAFVFSSSESTWGRRPKGELSIPLSSFPLRPHGAPAAHEVSCRAQTPSIPPQFRPATGQLSEYHILFEAEWRRVPPVDPFLLKRIDGPFFVVLAAWNLSLLEQAILRTKFV